MDSDQKTPSAETLRQLPYSELKKIAKQRGIKGNLKAEKIIAALTSSTDSDDTDSFCTPAAKNMNSSRKNKQEKFDEDSMTPLVTPRRGTYSIGSPITLKEATPVVNSSWLTSSTVVNANESSVLEVSNVASSAFNESSVLDMSNVTVGRGSERKLRKRKVSFLSPVMTPHTPKNSSLKMRPKTPIVPKTPLFTTITPSSMKELKVNLGERIDTSFHLAPLIEKISTEADTTSMSFMANGEESAKKKPNASPKSTSLLVSSDVSTKKKNAVTPIPRSVLNKSGNLSKKRMATPTPNFKKIHEKAFEKMESVDDYQKRIVQSAKKIGLADFKANKITKPRSKIPAFGGIPFIPSVPATNIAKWESTLIKKSNKPVEEKKKPKKDAENINTRSKTKFDLKASLSRKLGYKPYSGPLKPLTPSSLLNTSTAVCAHKSKETPAKEPINKLVTSKRMQSRSILKGVRTNKRFELQMKNRKLD